jgi:hypothetical protein
MVQVSFRSNLIRTGCKWRRRFCDRLNKLIAIVKLSVNTDTVRAKFLYELQGNYYFNLDVIGDMSNIQCQQAGSNRVRISGAEGQQLIFSLTCLSVCPHLLFPETDCVAVGIAAPETLKIAIMSVAGYQAEFSVYLTGLNAREKAKSFEIMSRKMIDDSKFQTLEFQLYGSSEENPKRQIEATLQLRVFGQAEDTSTLSKGRFWGPMLSNQLQGYPGLTPNFDYRTATPKLYCTYFLGLVS